MPGAIKKFEVRYETDVVKHDIPSLDRRFAKIIKKTIEEKLAINPVEFGRPLHYTFTGHRRLRVGDYRVIYRIEKNLVIIVAIRHRKNVYSS